MKMTNNEIYEAAMKLNRAFANEDQYLPMKLNFYLQKNKKLLQGLAEDIDASRLKIASQYGELNEDGSEYNFTAENTEKANAELMDLFNLEQEVNIHTVNMDRLPEDLNLSVGQMDAIMFMID